MQNRQPSGFSLVEVVLSVLIVSLLFSAALTAVSASRAAQISLADRSRGYQLATDLMSEILAQPYYDLVYKTGMGPASDEAATGDRSLFDDADDYQNWTASPPQQQDGTDITGFTGWTRTVIVEWVNPTDTTASANSSDGAKIITVTVQRGARVVAQVVGIRSVAHTTLLTEGGL